MVIFWDSLQILFCAIDINLQILKQQIQTDFGQNYSVKMILFRRLQLLTERIMALKELGQNRFVLDGHLDYIVRNSP